MHRHGPTCLRGPFSRDRFPHAAPSPSIRQELVDRIRREIAEGTYETPEKWEAALERLFRRLEE